MSFWDGFRKHGMKEVACVAMLSGKDILVGKRRDNGRWTFPGGHLEKGELPAVGASRELYEEAGVKLKPDELTHLQSEDVKGGDGIVRRIHAYKADLPANSRPKTTTEHDPDDEIDGDWQWVPRRLPRDIARNLHVPMKDNVLLRHLKDSVKLAFIRRLRAGLSDDAIETIGKVTKEIPQQYAQNYDAIQERRKRLRARRSTK